jgi:poly(A) polymerase
MAVGAIKGVDAALRGLRAREDVTMVEEVARREGISVRIVGGAVRDAFLGRRGGDLDLTLPASEAPVFAEALARAAATRVVTVGSFPRRILKIPLGAREIDIWQTEEPPDKDLLRRDFTINALAFDLPGGSFTAPKGALQDLRRRRLVLPRPGVLEEDPLRVVRVARLIAELPGFHLSKKAVPEVRRAARRLQTAAPERRLAELDRILEAPVENATRALRQLEQWGALPVLLRSTTARQRRRGLSLVGRMKIPSPPVARALLLASLGAEQALSLLGKWKVTRRELQLAGMLLRLPRRRTHRATSRRDVVVFLRSVSPFFEEAVLFLRAAGDRGTQILCDAVESVLRRPSSLSKILRPRRPLDAAAVSGLLGLPEGPALGNALRALDTALAAGEIRGERAARRFLERWARGG